MDAPDSPDTLIYTRTPEQPLPEPRRPRFTRRQMVLGVIGAAVALVVMVAAVILARPVPHGLVVVTRNPSPTPEPTRAPVPTLALGTPFPISPYMPPSGWQEPISGFGIMAAFSNSQPERGYLCGNLGDFVGLAITSDGGTTWSTPEGIFQVANDHPGCVIAVDSLDASDVVIATTSCYGSGSCGNLVLGQLYRSYDGGVGWHQQRLPGNDPTMGVGEIMGFAGHDLYVTTQTFEPDLPHLLVVSHNEAALVWGDPSTHLTGNFAGAPPSDRGSLSSPALNPVGALYAFGDLMYVQLSQGVTPSATYRTGDGVTWQTVSIPQNLSFVTRSDNGKYAAFTDQKGSDLWLTSDAVDFTMIPFVISGTVSGLVYSTAIAPNGTLLSIFAAGATNLDLSALYSMGLGESWTREGGISQVISRVVVSYDEQGKPLAFWGVANGSGSGYDPHFIGYRL